MTAGKLIAAALVLAAAPAAFADPPKAALGVPAGGQEATIRAAWKGWIKGAQWAEAGGPAAPVVTACLATDPACAAGLAPLAVDRTRILSLIPPAAPGGEPFVVGRIYDRAGVLITSSQRACARCATNRATLTAEVGKLLDALRESAERLNTRVVIEVAPGGPQVLLDGAPVELAAGGLPVAPGAHTITIAGDCWDMAPVPVIVSSGETVRATLPATRRVPRLRIRTHPAGASVTIDGAPAPGLEVETSAGAHRVTAAKDGWQSASQEVTFAGCETKDVELVLMHRGSRGPVPWIAAIGGGVAIGAGLALIIADRPQVDGSNRSATYRDSAPLGAVVAGVGVVSVGVAIYLWKFRDPPLVPAVVVPTDGGAVGVATWEF